MATLPLPELFDPGKVPELYLERSALAAKAGEAFARRLNLRPASQDAPRIAVFGIDCQVAFCTPGASLFVPGAVEDMQRAIGWLYRHLHRITELHFSLDTHRLFQIFHPAWWVDERGAHPEPFTPIFHQEVRSGRWRAIRHHEASLEYTRKLEATGRYVLTIWPYHAMLGGLSHALVPALMEAAVFHAAARQAPTHFVIKGLHELTESYSVLSPEVTELSGRPVGRFREALVSRLMGFERVYVFGEAKSHCVLSTLRDLHARLAGVDPRLAAKIWILEDAMSPVPPPPVSPLPAHLDFPKLADQALEAFRAAGMRVVKTTDPV